MSSARSLNAIQTRRQREHTPINAVRSDDSDNDYVLTGKRKKICIARSDKAAVYHAQPHKRVSSSHARTPGSAKTSETLVSSERKSTDARSRTSTSVPTKTHPNKVKLQCYLTRDQARATSAKQLVFSEGEGWQELTERVKRLYRGQNIQYLSFRPHPAYGLPKPNFIEIGKIGNMEREAVHYDLVTLSQKTHSLDIEVDCGVL